MYGSFHILSCIDKNIILSSTFFRALLFKKKIKKNLGRTNEYVQYHIF